MNKVGHSPKQALCSHSPIAANLSVSTSRSDASAATVSASLPTASSSANALTHENANAAKKDRAMKARERVDNASNSVPAQSGKISPRTAAVEAVRASSAISSLQALNSTSIEAAQLSADLLSWRNECSTPTTPLHTGNSVSPYECDNTLIHIPVNARNEITSEEKSFTRISHSKDNKKGTAVQTGIDRYFNKRKRNSPGSGTTNSSKIPKTMPATPSKLGDNQFALLDEEASSNSKPKSQKPPPIYLREQNSNMLVKVISQNIGENCFHVVPITKGKIRETKIQIYNEAGYRKMIDFFDQSKKSYYTYQLKSAKGLSVVIKGIDSFVDCGEVKAALHHEGFPVKSVFNIQNRNKVPQPLFRVELEFNSKTLEKGEPHPIYSLRYLLHRKITVEEPHKRSGPIQCQNCQEFGHTKKYCTLTSVCVICGDLHQTHLCQKTKEDANVKKCGNCGGNHTANYRGCPVYQTYKSKPKPKVVISNTTSLQQNSRKIPFSTVSSAPIAVNSTSQPRISYANAVKGSNHEPVITQDAPQSTLEQTLQMFIQNMSIFMASMQNMMQDMIKNQNLLLQTLLAKP